MSIQPATSAIFLQAFNLQTRNTLKAIELYTREVTEFNPENYVAWNNMGCCKVQVGRETKNIDLIAEGKADIEKSISLSSQFDTNPYYTGKSNLAWAKIELSKINTQENASAESDKQVLQDVPERHFQQEF